MTPSTQVIPGQEHQEMRPESRDIRIPPAGFRQS
jgi:hypothetical protein